MDSAAAPHSGLYRPGYPFTEVELQSLTSQGVLAHMLADVYAERVLPVTAGLRAAAASVLLSRTLREEGVLCGETAAWVIRGKAAPARSSVITRGVYRRPTDGPWRIHQVSLEASHVSSIGPMRVTTPTRTAADIFCGIGTTDDRRGLDQMMNNPEVADQLYYWPAIAEPLDERDYRIWRPAAQDHKNVDHRMNLLGELMQDPSVDPDDVAAITYQTLGVRDRSTARAGHIAELLNQCASRRLPTVRYTS